MKLSIALLIVTLTLNSLTRLVAADLTIQPPPRPTDARGSMVLGISTNSGTSLVVSPTNTPARNELIRRHDRNGNGKIDEAEGRGFRRESAQLVRSQARERSAAMAKLPYEKRLAIAFDLDGDGKASREEIERCLARKGQPASSQKGGK